MTPTPPQDRRNQLAPPDPEVDNSSTTQLSYSTPVPIHSPTAQSQMEKETIESSDILYENSVLKEELARLRDERKTILDHSIVSDQRLLQFTEEIFPIPHPLTTNALGASVPAATFHSETQTDSSFDRNNNDLDIANNKIKELQRQIEILSRPCERCAILREEAGNMISSIRSLEEENNILKNRQSDSQKICTLQNKEMLPLALRNSFGVLSEKDEPKATDEEGFSVVTNKRKKQKQQQYRHHATQKVKNVRESRNCTYISERPLQTPFSNVTVIGDSHVRNLAKLIGSKVTEDTSISGLCKPGAGVLSVKPTTEPPLGHCYVLMAGTNDVDAGREDTVFNHLEEVLLTCTKSSSVLLVPLPTRYDLPPDSRVHQTVNRVNTYLADLSQRIDNVEMVDIGCLRRRHHTSHGLHLRTNGKRLLAALIAGRLADFRGARSPSPKRTQPSYATAFSGTTPTVVPRKNQSHTELSCTKYFLRGKKTISGVK